MVQKFLHPKEILNFKNRLLATGDELLVEGNYWHDNYFGFCYCEKCSQLPKHNQLGKILMRIREELKDV